MKLHKILPIIFFMIAMMISCSQETVINENISGEATTPDTKICVNIKTENSRTVRPEITKWEITVTNKSDANLEFSRTIDGKATSATFVNITDGEYEITVRGIHEDSNRKTIILTANPTFEVKPNTVTVCEIIPEDNFAYDTNGNPYNGNLSIQISGLKDLFTEGETLLLTCTKLPETNNESDTTCDLIFNEEGKTSSVISEIPVGSYKIEITHNDEAKTKTKVNLVKDPVVNIYDNTTTEINWEWNYDSKEINTDQELKGIKIPVWNKPVSNWDYSENSIPARNGYLTANALFAEPIWDEFYEFKSLKCTSVLVTECTHDVTIPASEFDFINCAYDNAGALWVLSYADETYATDTQHTFNSLYVLKNVSTGDEYNVTTDENEKILKDFAVATVGEQKYLLCITDTADGNNIKSFKIEGEGGDLNEGTPYCSYGGNQYITAIYAKDNNLYIAISDIESETGSRFIKILKTELAVDGSDNILEYKDDDGSEVLKLDINSFIEVEDVYSFQSPAFAISDMYINEDKSKLYVTAGCVNYDGNSWNNNQDYGVYQVYHSFGGLFVYELDEAGNLKKDDDGSITVESYGINNNEITTIDPETENDIDPNPFLTTGGEGILELEENIMQATSDDSSYFAGPRYIIPSGNDLLIVDSGFYGMYKSEYKQLTDCEKRNRIFTYNITENGLSFNSITTLDDSISFDYDYLTSSSQY